MPKVMPKWSKVGSQRDGKIIKSRLSTSLGEDCGVNLEKGSHTWPSRGCSGGFSLHESTVFAFQSCIQKAAQNVSKRMPRAFKKALREPLKKRANMLLVSVYFWIPNGVQNGSQHRYFFIVFGVSWASLGSEGSWSGFRVTERHHGVIFCDISWSILAHSPTAQMVPKKRAQNKKILEWLWIFWNVLLFLVGVAHRFALGFNAETPP